MSLKSAPKNMSPIVMGLVVGGFVWLVFDSLALGIVAGGAAFFLGKRDAKTDPAPHSDREASEHQD